MMNPFIERYKKLGKTVDVKARPQKALRINTIKAPKHLEWDAKITLQKIPFLKNGYWYTAPFSLSSSKQYLLGHIYIQEAAAQIPAEVLAPTKNNVVLDMCAAPGGKTTHIAMLMGNSGTLVAIDNKQERMHALHNNIERLGVSNTTLYCMDASDVKKLNREFDKILLDAPCMGNYADDSTWFTNRTLQQIPGRVNIQQKLLLAGIDALKKGGILVYSTCSLEPEENEMNIDWLIAQRNVRIEEIKLNIGEAGITNPFGKQLHNDIAKTKRIWPGQMQGFFIAKIRKE